MKVSPAIAVIGPTSSGKSALAVRLARQFNGEIISADSRQVYRGLDIGSGKVPRDKLSKSYNLKAKRYLHQGIPHHLLDVANPRQTFTVARYQKLANRAMVDITHRGKVSIICGGTGFYIDALLGRVTIPSVLPNTKLRRQLEKLDSRQLFRKLEKLNPERAKNIDRHNRRRLVRAIEIAMALNVKGSPWGPLKDCPWNWLLIGIKLKPDELRQKISTRLQYRISHGLIVEVKKLHENGLSWKRFENLGLEYRFVARYLRGLLTKEQMIRELETANWHYAKRQMTWFKRDRTIHWVKNYQEAERLIIEFLKVRPFSPKVEP